MYINVLYCVFRIFSIYIVVYFFGVVKFWKYGRDVILEFGRDVILEFGRDVILEFGRGRTSPPVFNFQKIQNPKTIPPNCLTIKKITSFF